MSSASTTGPKSAGVRNVILLSLATLLASVVSVGSGKDYKRGDKMYLEKIGFENDKLTLVIDTMDADLIGHVIDKIEELLIKINEAED